MADGGLEGVCSYGLFSGFPGTVMGRRKSSPTLRYYWARSRILLALKPYKELFRLRGKPFKEKLRKMHEWPFLRPWPDPAVLRRNGSSVRCPWLFAVDKRSPGSATSGPIARSFRFAAWRRGMAGHQPVLRMERRLDREHVFRLWHAARADRQPGSRPAQQATPGVGAR